MLTVKNVADLDLLEAEIAEEEKNLQLLKESLDEAENLTARMIKMLNDFDERIAEIDPVVMPIYRNVQTMSLVSANVESTLDVLKLIESFNQLADAEEDTLGRALLLENTSDFITSVNRLGDALEELRKRRLSDFCTNTYERLMKLEQSGLAKLLTTFQDGLQQWSLPYDPRMLLEGSVERPVLPELVSENLKLLSGFALAASNSQVYAQLEQVYTQIRSDAINKSMASHLLSLQEGILEIHKSYQKGTHLYAQTLDLLVSMYEEEERFALQVLPSTDIVKSVLKVITANWLSLTTSLTDNVEKALSKGHFSDQIFIFDLIEQFTGKYDRAHGGLSMLKDALIVLTACGGHFLVSLRREIESEATQSSSSRPTPPNATVFELTTTLLNCLRRMAEYTPVVEALLVQLVSSQPSQVIQTIPTTFVSLAQYYQSCLRLIEAAVELRAKSFRKPIAGLVFRLNNYRYIQRVLVSSHMNDILPSETEQHFTQVLQQLKDQYTISWKAIARLLDENEPLPSGAGIGFTTTAKDRAKIFINEINDAVKVQSGLSCPDPEFRFALREMVKKEVVDQFDAFYAANPTVFLSMASKGIRFDQEVLLGELAKILSA